MTSVALDTGSIRETLGLTSASGLYDHFMQIEAVTPGEAVSYPKIANMIGRPARVIQQSGALGGFYWGTTRKQAMQLWELAQVAAVKPIGERP